MQKRYKVGLKAFFIVLFSVLIITANTFVVYWLIKLMIWNNWIMLYFNFRLSQDAWTILILLLVSNVFIIVLSIATIIRGFRSVRNE